MVWKGMQGFRAYRKRKRRGELFPAFQFISVTDDCNLRCQGCWVSTADERASLDVEMIHGIIRAGKEKQAFFYGILGGEPLMYPPLTDIFQSHPDCYFQLFTNGTLLSPDMASRLRDLGNVTPLISLEGNEVVSDIRRGGRQVYDRTLNAIAASTGAGLITGVAISVCKSNIDMALSEAFVRKMHDMGVLYIWYYIYRPAGSNPQPELALSKPDIDRLRLFLVNGRKKFPMILIDSYWDSEGQPFCPAANGLSHHINARGYVEPCPVLQFASDNIAEKALEPLYEESGMLRDFRKEIHQKTRGCVFMEDPGWLAAFASRQGSLNTSNRPTYFESLSESLSLVSHGSGDVIPERGWLYKKAKKTAFFGMSAYG
jgi:MoaA/NifB/PqqE/SkfB family radical SAM enzyme